MITAIVLAAGMSKRLGVAKQLLDYQGRPMIRHVVETILNSRVQNTLVVVGSRAQEVSAALKGLPISLVINENYAQGQSTSVIRGVNALLKSESFNNDPIPEGVLFALGDQPLLETQTINLLIEEYNKHRGIVVPYYLGSRGNPVIFSRKYLEDLYLLTGDEGARRIIERYKKEVTPVEVEDPGIAFDIDTWEDYQKLIGQD